jgi:hypothetical protein
MCKIISRKRLEGSSCLHSCCDCGTSEGLAVCIVTGVLAPHQQADGVRQYTIIARTYLFVKLTFVPCVLWSQQHMPPGRESSQRTEALRRSGEDTVLLHIVLIKQTFGAGGSHRKKPFLLGARAFSLAGSPSLQRYSRFVRHSSIITHNATAVRLLQSSNI